LRLGAAFFLVAAFLAVLRLGAALAFEVVVLRFAVVVFFTALRLAGALRFLVVRLMAI
jgi:hypothetical protein